MAAVIFEPIFDIERCSEVFIVGTEEARERVRDQLHMCGSGRTSVACLPSGLANWDGESSDRFQGKKIAILCDPDTAPGAERIANFLVPFASSIKIVVVDRRKIDVNEDVVAAHVARVGIHGLTGEISDTPEWTIPGVLLCDVEPERVEWIWEQYLPKGKITILEGDPDRGKSLIALDVAARLTRGAEMPDGAPCAPGGVVLLTSEDGLSDTIRPRLEAADADLRRVRSVTHVGEGASTRAISFPADVKLLRKAVNSVGAKLIIVDPLVGFLDRDINPNSDMEVRQALAQIAALCEDTGATLIGIRHLNKCEERSPINRGGGSVAFGAAARAVLLAAKNPDEADEYVLAPVKANLARNPKSLAYRIEQGHNGSPRVHWLGPSDHSAASLLSASVGPNLGPRDRAVAFLREALKGGPRDSNALYAEGEQRGISKRTLRRASEQLGVNSRANGFQGSWVWELCEEQPSGDGGR